MFGYMDESGTPGVAMNKDDWLAISLLIFNNKKLAEKASKKLDNLRIKLKLPDTYEFHRTHNSKVVQAEVEKILCNLEYDSITVASRKQTSRNTNYLVLVENLITELKIQDISNLTIQMDRNPTLYKLFKKELKRQSCNNIKITEAESCKSPCVQLADYIVNLSVRKLRKLPGSDKNYANIENKTKLIIK